MSDQQKTKEEVLADEKDKRIKKGKGFEEYADYHALLTNIFLLVLGHLLDLSDNPIILMLIALALSFVIAFCAKLPKEKKFLSKDSIVPQIFSPIICYSIFLIIVALRIDKMGDVFFILTNKEKGRFFIFSCLRCLGYSVTAIFIYFMIFFVYRIFRLRKDLNFIKSKKRKTIARIVQWRGRKRIIKKWLPICIIIIVSIPFSVGTAAWYMPNIIPSIKNSSPSTFRVREKEYVNRDKFAWTISPEGDEGRFIYKYNNNWVKYMGPYENWNPNGEGVIIDRNNNIIFEGRVINEKPIGKCEKSYFILDDFRKTSSSDGNEELNEEIREAIKAYQEIPGLSNLKGDLYNSNYDKDGYLESGRWVFDDDNKYKYKSFDGKFENFEKNDYFIGYVFLSGKLKWKDGTEYDGEFGNGRMSRDGKLTFGDINRTDGDANESIFKGVFQYGDTFEGTYYASEHQPVGQPKKGKLTFSNNEYYEYFDGEFDENGELVKGKVSLKEEKKIIDVHHGFDLTNLLQGEYIMLDEEGNKLYVSFISPPRLTVKIDFEEHPEFQKDHPEYVSFYGEGQVEGVNLIKLISGELNLKNGSKYKGKFEDNKPHDNNGNFIKDKEIEYTGGFHAGQFDGSGELKTRNSFWKGIFEGGIFTKGEWCVNFGIFDSDYNQEGPSKFFYWETIDSEDIEWAPNFQAFMNIKGDGYTIPEGTRVIGSNKEQLSAGEIIERITKSKTISNSEAIIIESEALKYILNQ